MKFIGLAAADFRPTEGLVYRDVLDLHSLYDKIAYRSNLILCGPKGIGKSLSVAAWATHQDAPIITFDCSEDVRRGQLYGHYIVQGSETPFVLGALTNAFEVANESGSCILVLEEVNALTPQLQKALSPLDFRKKVELPEIQKVFRLEADARLWVVATMNNTVYGGVNELNEDLKSRFRMIALEYPKMGQEREIVDELFPKWALPAIKVGTKTLDIRDAVIRLAAETRTTSFEYALSPRDVVAILEDAQVAGLNNALWMSLGKFEDSDRETYLARIHSIFGSKALGSRA